VAPAAPVNDASAPERPGQRLPREPKGRPPGAPEVELRLAIGPSGVGLELADPVRVGCARVLSLTTDLPSARFPLDVSGGVARFRHRLGELRFVEVELSAPAFERWAAPRLRGIVGARAPEVWVRVRPGAATVCVSESRDPDRQSTTPSPVVAFDVHLLAAGEDLVLVVAAARGADLPAPALAIAIACVQALLGPVAERAGAVFVVKAAAGALARSLMPEAGARAPSAAGVRWRALSADAASWVLQAGYDEPEAPPAEAALLAREVAATLTRGDDALVEGATDDARRSYLVALANAPRHAEIVRRILEIDARVPGRAEAALATFGELQADDRSGLFGAVPGLLLLQHGDGDRAVASLERAGDEEPAPALAAKILEYAAAALDGRDAEASLRLLDRALARAPRSSGARWARVARRVDVGRLEEALADLEHLDALARGPRAKHLVWVRAGHLWRAAGLAGRAAPVFERALRYVPDEPSALAGLGVALVAEGIHARGVALLTRAIERAEETRRPIGAFALDLATTLADRLDDLPSGIARVAAVGADEPQAVLARGLEGRWRARLGDVAGAGLAYARMRERIASHASLEAVDLLPQGPGAIALLSEAAQLELDTRRDPIAAQRYLAEALRLQPHDEALRAAYRKVGAIVAGPRAGPSPSAPLSRLPVPVDDNPADLEARVEALTRRVHADPADDAAADELASVLEKLDRGHELLALLSGRLEDATPTRRAALAPKARDALMRLASHASHEGREVEAELFRSAAAALLK
jgi:tetratricopeptide (TPR) repeat protein